VVVVNGRKLLGGSCKSALDVMRDTPELSDMAALVGTLTPKLRDALSSSDGKDLTFFVPSNTALAAMKAAMPDASNMLLQHGNELSVLLAYAVVPGRRLSMGDLSGAPLRTALGDAVSPLTSVSGGVVDAAGSSAKVVQSLQACHATLHVVDRVLIPLSLPDMKSAADKVKSAMAQG
jgi:uncharacterized surface protein with fasciclin (FAS1) repeats